MSTEYLSHAPVASLATAVNEACALAAVIGTGMVCKKPLALAENEEWSVFEKPHLEEEDSNRQTQPMPPKVNLKVFVLKLFTHGWSFRVWGTRKISEAHVISHLQIPKMSAAMSTA
jgi:hypothetical protein